MKRGFFFFFNRAAKDLEERRSHYEPSLHPGVPDDIDHSFKIEENDFVPHFQRVSISGEDTSGVSLRIQNIDNFDCVIDFYCCIKLSFLRRIEIIINIIKMQIITCLTNSSLIIKYRKNEII